MMRLLFIFHVQVGMRGVVPLPALAAVRPPASVLHPSSLGSVLGQSLIQTGLTFQLLRTVRANGAAAATATQDEQEEEVDGEGKSEQQRGRRRPRAPLLPGQPPEPADPLGSLMFLSQLVESAVGTINTVRGRPFRWVG